MKYLLLCFLAIAGASATRAQSYSEAVQLLEANRLTEASARLDALSDDPKDGDRALLLRAFIDGANEHHGAAFRHFRAFYDRAKNPYPYFSALAHNPMLANTDVLRNPGLRPLLREIRQDPNANATVRSEAAYLLAQSYQETNEIEATRQATQDIGDIGPWSTLGAFENVSGSGFNKDYGALAHPGADAKFTNRQGAPIRWFDMPHPTLNHWWDFGQNHQIDNSIIYAQTFVQSPRAQEALLLSGVSGSLKIWVNDFLVVSEQEERDTYGDVYNYKIRLQPGANRILVQVGSSDLENSNFLVRLADTSGELLRLPAKAEYEAYTKAQPYPLVRVPVYAEAYFEKKVAKSPDDLLLNLVLLNAYLKNNKRFEARQVADRLKKLAPGSTVVASYVITAYDKDQNITAANRERERIKASDTESLYALILRYSDAFEKEDWDAASKLLARRKKLYGDNARVALQEITLLVKQKDRQNLADKVTSAYGKYPDDDALFTLYLALTASAKSPGKSIARLEKYLETHHSESLDDELVKLYSESGRNADAVRMLKEQAEDRPYAVGNYIHLAEAYTRMRQYREALQWQQRAIDLAPYVGAFYYSKGLIYEAMNRDEDAKKAMSRTIRYAATNYDARKKLRALEGKKDLFSYFRTNDPERLYKDAQTADRDSKENAVLLLHDKQFVVYPEQGASEEHAEYLAHVLTKSGVDEFKELSIPYNPYTQRLIVEDATLYKKDGSKIKAETDDNQLVFSALEQGDAVHVSYRLENSYTGKLAEHFWEDFTFNSGYPVGTARFSLIVPEQRKFQYQVYNTKLEPKVTDADGYKLYVWERKNSPAIEPEPYMPPVTDVTEKLVITSIPDWSYVANWYSDLSAVKARPDFEVKEMVKKLLADGKARTDIEKARLFYNYIEQTCHYSNVSFLHSALTPQKASRTLHTSLGDCKDLSTLFVAMCHESGVDANLVLVDTRDNGDANLTLPSIGFNHCIAALHTGDKQYLIELTDNHNPFGAMGSELINANGLYIPKNGQSTTGTGLSKLNSKSRVRNSNDRVTTLQLSGTTASIHRTIYRVGAEASAGRQVYGDTKPDERIRALSGTLSDELHRNVKLDELKLHGLDELNDTLVMDYQFHVDNYTSPVAGMQVFKLPWGETFRTVDFVALDKRKYLLNLHSQYATPVERETITVKLPAGRHLAETPRNESYRHPVATYSVTYRVAGDKITAVREVHYLKDHVTPEEYESFKTFINQLNEADNKQLAYR